MKENVKMFYNAVIQSDLFFAIYDYLRFNQQARTIYHFKSLPDFDNFSYEEWTDVAVDTISWLEEKSIAECTYAIKL